MSGLIKIIRLQLGEGYEQSKMAINIDNCFIEGTGEQFKKI